MTSASGTNGADPGDGDLIPSSPTPTKSRVRLIVGAPYKGVKRWTGVIMALPKARRSVTELVSLSLLRVGLAVPVPLIMGALLKLEDTNGAVQRVITLALITLGLTVAGNALNLYITVRAANFATSGSVQTRQTLHRIISAAPIDSLRSRGHGGLFDVVGTNVDRVETAVTALVVIALPAAVLASGMAVLVTILNWKLVLVGAAFVPLAILVSYLLGQTSRKAWEEHHYAWADYTEFIMRATRFSALTKASAAEDVEQRLHGVNAKKISRAGRNAKVMNAVYTAAMRSAISIAGMGVLVVGLAMEANGTLTFGELAAFFTALMLLRQPLQLLIETVGVVHQGGPAHDIVEDLQKLETEKPPYADGTQKLKFEGHIAADNLAFAYPDSEPLFTGLSFELVPGETTVVIGANGAGKSTMVSLLLGLREPIAGQITADGVPYSDLDMPSLRKQMSLLVQELMLDEGTVHSIISYGLENVPRSTVETAAELAEAAAFVEKLPQGYDTVIGRNGIELSLGQHQRLAIARALARKPRVLLLDEPTNHLDPEAVQAILKTLRSLDDPPAILVVTHHHDVMAWADHTVTITAPDPSGD